MMRWDTVSEVTTKADYTEVHLITHIQSTLFF